MNYEWHTKEGRLALASKLTLKSRREMAYQLACSIYRKRWAAPFIPFEYRDYLEAQEFQRREYEVLGCYIKYLRHGCIESLEYINTVVYYSMDRWPNMGNYYIRNLCDILSCPGRAINCLERIMYEVVSRPNELSDIYEYYLQKDRAYW